MTSLTRLLPVFALSLCLAACEDAQSAPGSQPHAPSVQPFVAQGQVVNSAGQPVAGAQVILDNTVYTNSNQTTTTGADGRYRFTLTQLGGWRVYAKKVVAYHGRSYEFNFHPNTYDSFSGQQGAIRNFTWKLQGQQPPPQVGTYGGLIYIHNDPMIEFYDTENVAFTFTPSGPLVDGSAGKTIVTKHGAPRTDDFKKIPDMPIGRYTVSGVHLPSGKAVKLRLSGQGTYQPQLTFDFTELNYCRNCVAIEVTLP